MDGRSHASRRSLQLIVPTTIPTILASTVVGPVSMGLCSRFLALTQQGYQSRHRIFSYLTEMLFFSPCWPLPIFRNDFGDRFGGQDASVVLKLVVGEIILSEQVEMPHDWGERIAIILRSLSRSSGILASSN